MWYSIPESVSVGAGEQKVVTLTQTDTEKTTVSDLRPRTNGDTRNYDGSITFKVGNDELKFNTRLRKARKASKL